MQANHLLPIFLIMIVLSLRVAAVPLLQMKTVLFEDEFLTDIRECVTSVSGCNSPVGIMLYADCMTDTNNLLQKMDHSMSPETVIVGDRCGEFLYGGDLINTKSNWKAHPLSVAAVALLFMRDRKKPHAVGSNSVSCFHRGYEK